MNILVLWFNQFINILFPIHCLVCKTTGSDLCNKCLINLKWPKRQKHHWVTSLWNYRDPNVEILMRHIKNIPNDRLAVFFARLFAERILNRPTNQHSWIIIPIPISTKRFRERGYNQSKVLAKPIAELFKFPLVVNVLIKKKHTNKQGTSTSKEDRFANITGAFSIRNPELIIGKNIILVDDIITTGATLSEARITLLEAGAKRVLAWTLAN